MHALKDVSLKLYSTMRLGGKAAYLIEIDSKQKLKEAVDWARDLSLPVIVIGQGSNIVWKDEGFKGLVIVNRIPGYEEVQIDDTSCTIKIGAGEDWDSIVKTIVSKGLCGAECLSLIPGTAGATPIQNVGAYGTEVSNILIELEAYDNKTGTFVTINNADCDFGYRTSRFKTRDKGRFYITSITLKLQKIVPMPPFYKNLQDYLDEHKISEYSPQIIREAVIAIRSRKLPDWHVTATNGSFFANPIITTRHYRQLKASYPSIIGWEHGDGYKISGGWLLETAGFKGYYDEETGMATSDKTALVVINENAKSTAGLLHFRNKITNKVKELYDIELEQEPELLP